MRSRNPLLLFGLLLLYFPAPAMPPDESRLPALKNFSSGELQSTRATGTIRILAIMVEFKEEENRFTTGNGTFDLPFLQNDNIIIDPLPHDRGYFEAHLEFAKNYFHTVSGGQLDIRYEVIPEVIRLNNPMSYYSPTGETNEQNYKLANLARDAWAQAYDLDIPDLSDYEQDRTMFIVFHAGSGRNIELTGTSLDKTPQDIPSVYLGTGSLQRLLDDPGFHGFDIGDPQVRVTNTALLPQTQSRSGEDITGEPYVLQLSINGLVTANVGSFIGLPDLFNTETGASAIGRFGLMDGASIFSYLGMFPPEPSAWEKIHLGWEQPFDIQIDTGEPVSLPAVSKRRPNSIARHSISTDEYFLVENRHRNPSEEPLEITIRTPEGAIETVLIDPDDDRFDPFSSSDYDELLVPGVITNVSNFDWSLPGGPDTGQENDQQEIRILNGGILIWHIDEAVIRNKIDDNRVNANTGRRGVQLVEADGARDIGRPPGPGQDRFVNGHAFDFWWKGNNFTVITATDSLVIYENRFGPDTRPSNESNTGNPTFFEFYDFSDNIPTAHFFARSLGGTYVQPLKPGLPALPQHAGLESGSAAYPAGPKIVNLSDENEQKPHLLISASQGIYSIPLHTNDDDYRLIEHPNPSPPLVLNGEVITGQIDPMHPADRQDVASWSLQNGNWTRNWIREDLPSGPGLLSLNPDGLLHLDHTSIHLETNGNLYSGEDARAYQRSGDVDQLYTFIEDDRLELSDGTFHYDLIPEERDSRRKYTGNLRFSSNSNPSFFLLTDNRFSLVDKRDGQWQLYPVIQSSAVSWPAFGDWSGDQSLDIIITDKGDNSVKAYNRDGGLLDFFPLYAPEGRRFTGSALLADITGDGRNEMIIASVDSLTMNIHAYDRNADAVEGFPLLAGSLDNERQRDPLPMLLAGGYLITVSPSGDVRAWELPELEKIAWGRVYGPQPGNKAGINTDLQRTERPSFGILNERETYNWPNPAKDHTHIRFETSEQARIDITVINPSGSTVFEKQTESQGRYPQDIRLNTSSWGNGIYFARVRADNGRDSESKMIKIVVTR